jgi:hypothetical protein
MESNKYRHIGVTKVATIKEVQDSFFFFDFVSLC